MAVIKYEDLFDFPGYQKAIKDAESANKEFGKTVESINARIGKQYNEIKTELNDYVGVLKSFNVNQKGASDSIIRTGESALTASKKIAEQKRVMMELVGTTDLTGKSVNELKTGLKGLESQYNSIAGKSDDARAKKAALAAEARRVTAAVKEQTAALKATTQVLDAAEGSYQSLQNELSSIGKQLKAMPDAFNKATGQLNANNKAAVDLAKRYMEINNVLKTADSQLGNYQRNVGNYASGFSGLNNSVAQLTRELPALGINVQTFFLAISNNLPIFFDQLKQTNTQLKEMRAEGQKAPSMLQALGKSFISLQTLLSIGVTLLTLYGKELVDFVASLFNGKKGLDEFKKSQELLNKAFKDNSYKDAIRNVNELTINIDLAKKGYLDKKEVLNQYNQTLGQTIGETKSLEEAERLLIKNGDAYIKMTLYKAAANLALNEAAEKALQAAKNAAGRDGLENADLRRSAFANASKEEIATYNKLRNEANDAFFKGDKKRFEELNAKADALFNERTEKGADKKLKKEQASLEGIAKSLQQKAAELAKQFNFDFFGGSFDDKKSSSKDGKSSEDKLAENIKKQQELLKSALEKAIALDELNYQKGLITEEEFQINKLNLIKKYTDAAIELENKKGKKADQKTINDFNKERISAEADYLKFINELTDQNRKEDLERAKEAIKAEADLKVQSLLTEKEATLSSKRFTDKEKEAIELDYQNRVDTILIESLKRRITLETDAAKKAALEKEAIELERAINSRNRQFDEKAVEEKYKAEIAAAKNAFDIIRAGRNTSFKEELAFLEKLKAIKIKYAKDTAEEELAIAELKAEYERELREELEQTIFQGIQQGLDIAQNLVNAKFEERIAQLEAQKQRELDLAGNNAAARAAIEEQYQKKVAEQKNKQAKAERTFALFNVAINTAQGVTKSIAQFGMPAAIPFIALTVLQGALQAAAILSKPLPKYKKGRKGGPAELAIVDEAGPELIVDKSGRLKEVGGGGARITTLAQGDSVIPAGATRDILKSGDRDKILSELSLTARMSSSLRTGKQEEMVHIMARAMQSGQINQEALEVAFEKAIKKLPHTDFFFDEKGFYKRREEQGRRTTYLNDLTKI